MTISLHEGQPDTVSVFLKTDPFARTSSLPPTGGRGVGTAPSLTGRGGGWVESNAAEAMSRLPGPPHRRSPHKSPSKTTGARWGERGGSAGDEGCKEEPRARAGRRCDRSPGAADAAKVPAPLSRDGGPAAGVTPSEPQASDWRVGRAGPSTSCVEPGSSAARHRAWRVTGVTIWWVRSDRSEAP